MKALIGYGKSYASFGEVVQGRLSNSEDFLITIPINLWSTCELVCNRTSEITEIDCPLEKSKEIAEKMVEKLNIQHGYYIKIIFTRNIPIGKGLSSSTADMLSVVRAFQEVFGVIVTEHFISDLFVDVEAHDALHYYMSVIYNHRKGKLLKKLNHIPQYHILAIDEGNVVDTIQYNNNLKFSNEVLGKYDELYKKISTAYTKKDDVEIAKLSLTAAKVHAENSNNKFVSEIIKLADVLDGSLGVIVAHSGSFVGILFDYEFPELKLKEYAKEISGTLNKDTMLVKTLKLI